MPQLTKEQLIVEITNTLHKDKVIHLSNLASNSSFSMKDLIDLSFHSKPEIGFRAAWILESIFTKKPNDFIPHLNYFIEKFILQENDSVKRHFAKIASLITSKKYANIFHQELQNVKIEAIVETCFKWLLDSQTKVAVKVHCLQTLANLASTQSWIKNELVQTMDFLVETESYAFFARVKQIKKQLSKLD